jgi:hypothetical protein
MGKLPKPVEDAFYSGGTSPGVDYTLNDAVEVVGGPYHGEGGSVISLLQLDPEPSYLVETSTGMDIEVPQSSLRAIAEEPEI